MLLLAIIDLVNITTTPIIKKVILLLIGNVMIWLTNQQH
jgi:hypothetical protein